MPLVISPDNEQNDDSLAARIVRSRSAKKSRSPKRIYTPVNTFHRDINGSGGKSGRINHTITPLDDDPAMTPNNWNLSRKHTEVRGETSITSVPVGLPTPYTWGIIRQHMRTTHINDYVAKTSEMFDMTDDITYIGSNNGPEYRLFMDMQPEVVTIRKVSSVDKKGKTTNEFTTAIQYRRVLILAHPDDLDDEGNLTVDKLPVYFYPDKINTSQHRSAMSYDWVYSAEERLNEHRRQFLGWDFNTISFISDCDEFDKHFGAVANGGNYRAFDRLCDLAENMRTSTVVDRVWNIIDQLSTAVAATTLPDIKAYLINAMAQELRRLDEMEIPLQCYSDLHSKIDSLADKDLAALLVKQNMQLNLNGNLQKLHKKESQLSVPGNPNPKNNYAINPRYSKQQVNAITTQKPLVIVQAGAGTGKSTTINERMNYLEACDVKQNNIMVLSFTNAAADHIAELRPGVSSLTISGMIHSVYTHNFPNQQISTLKTIINSIPIYYGDQATTSNFLRKLAALLHDINRDGSNANMTRLSVFTERYTDQVIEVLNTIKQTTLELEIILSYLKIDDDDFAEPFDSPDYIIIDEVQDNSSYEFVFALRYAAKHDCSLYLVGDSSQTLYEFRSADPKALNALEGSGVFTPYRLTTNYRSNQEILDFANIHLKDIEANQYANIQLQANSLDIPTADSFTHKVQVYPVYAPTKTKFDENLPQFIQDETIVNFVNDNLAHDEPTAFLCPTRKEAATVEKFLTDTYPDVPLANLISARSYDTTTFSKYIAHHWDEVTAVDPTMAASVFSQQIRKRLKQIDPTTAKYPDAFTKRLAAWWSENCGIIQGHLNVYSVKSSTNPDGARREFFENLRQNIMNYEIKNNSIQQSLTHQKNMERKEMHAKMNPKLFVSTIHGVKGLEFDNTVVLQPPSTAAHTEDLKRQYYVALTRAKKRELIIVGEGDGSSQLSLDYEAMVHTLELRDQETARAAQEAAEDNDDLADDNATSLDEAIAIHRDTTNGMVNIDDDNNEETDAETAAAIYLNSVVTTNTND